MSKSGDARAMLRSSHQRPQFNMATEAWLPVRMSDGSPAMVGLVELFERAHLIADTAETDPLTNAALRRLLIVLTAQMVRLGDHDQATWNTGLRDAAGFSPADVRRLLAEQADYLWLFHPQHPFLQDIRLIDAQVEIELKAVSELVPTAPGDSESAWFTKPTEAPAISGRSPTESARLLTARWFYALPGNSSPVCAGVEFLRSQAGGAFSEGPATITHAFRIGPTLFHSLLRNLTPEMATPTPSGVAGLAWMDGQRPRLSQDAVYLASLSATATLLAGAGDDGLIRRLIRGGVPRPKDTTKQLRDLARDRDPHRLSAITTAKAGASVKTVRVSPGQHRLRALDHIRINTDSPNQILRGVVSGGDLWLGGRRECQQEHIDFLSGSKQGMAASPKWSDTTEWSTRASYLDTDSTDFKRLQECLVACFDSKRGVLTRLCFAIRLAVGEAGSDGSHKPAQASTVPAAALLAGATQIFLDAAGDIVERALTDPRDQQESELRAELTKLAQGTYEAVLEPFRNSPRYCEMVIRARAQLAERNLNEAPKRP